MNFENNVYVVYTESMQEINGHVWLEPEIVKCFDTKLKAEEYQKQMRKDQIPGNIHARKYWINVYPVS